MYVHVQEQSVGTLHRELFVIVLGGFHECHSIYDVRRKRGTVLLETGDFLLNVVLEQISKALLVPVGKQTELSFEIRLVKDFVNANTAAGSLAAVGWSNALARASNFVLSKLRVV